MTPNDDERKYLDRLATLGHGPEPALQAAIVRGEHLLKDITRENQERHDLLTATVAAQQQALTAARVTIDAFQQIDRDQKRQIEALQQTVAVQKDTIAHLQRGLDAWTRAFSQQQDVTDLVEQHHAEFRDQ